MKQGFTLIEVLIGMSIFTVVSVFVFLTANGILETISRNQWRSEAMGIIESEIETLRIMPYEDIGISGGYPTGKLSAQKTISLSGGDFILETTVRNIDDSFDGVSGGNPNDTAPADYKLVELKVSCQTCSNFVPVVMTTTVAPKNLETATNNGSLFVNVFDAYGQPVSEANVSVVNQALNPAISINDKTNLSGVLQLVDIPTSTAAYEIQVSKSGYSSERTYQSGAPENPNPAKPHATVASQSVTSISFAIDKVSRINFKTADKMCAAVPNVDYLLEGSKLIGAVPDVLKYAASSTTDSSGSKTISNLEWDAYNFSDIDGSYDIAGINSSSSLSLIVNPDRVYNLSWLMEPKNSLALLVSVFDDGGQPVSGAEIRLTRSGFDEASVGGRRSFDQTDWSGTDYDSQSGEIETESPAGEIALRFSGGYATSTQWLVSKTFDLGVSGVSFYNLKWLPSNQPAETGSSSLKFQIASNNDNAVWNFVGPDGTPDSFYSSSTVPLNSSHNGNRYLRYKVYIHTDDGNFTPRLEDVEIEFSSSCVPGWQSFFNGLTGGSYSLTVEKSGYQTFSDPGVQISGDWREYRATLTAQ